ncbi:MAG: nucleotidyltransferase domain-containing protein [Candidatus Nanohaloarchaea archaeon]
MIRSRKWHISELASESGVSQPTVSRTVEKLEENSVIDIRKKGRQKIVFVKRKDYLSDLIKVLLDQHNYLKKAADKFADKAREIEEVESIKLFGLVAQGTTDFGSDIDLLVVLNTKKEKVRDELMMLAEKTSDETGLHLSPTIMTEEKYSKEVEMETRFARSVGENSEILYEQ